MQKKASHICAIIVNYNSGSDVLDAVRSLYKSKTLVTHIVVVDNASRDGSLEACKKEFPRVHYIYNTQNIGFAAAVNIGIRFGLERDAEWIFLLNPDAYIESSTITKLLEQARLQPDFGILAPQIFSPETKDVWFSGGRISWARFRALHDDTRNAEEVYATEFASGCALLIAKEVFAQNGLFDERFFLYYEDADFCLRAQKHGIKTGVVSHAHAWHYEKSEEQKPHKIYWLVRSGLIFFDAHTPLVLRPWYVLHYILRRCKNTIKTVTQRLHKKEDPDVVAVAHAYRDYTYDKRHRQPNGKRDAGGTGDATT